MKEGPKDFPSISLWRIGRIESLSRVQISMLLSSALSSRPLHTHLVRSKLPFQTKKIVLPHQIYTRVRTRESTGNRLGIIRRSVPRSYPSIDSIVEARNFVSETRTPSKFRGKGRGAETGGSQDGTKRFSSRGGLRRLGGASMGRV